MTVGVGNGVGGMLQPACQLTGLFTPATTVSVGSGAEWLFQSAIYYQAQLVNGFLTNHPLHTRFVKNFQFGSQLYVDYSSPRAYNKSEDEEDCP